MPLDEPPRRIFPSPHLGCRSRSWLHPLLRDLHNRFRRQHAVSRATLLVQKPQDLLQRAGIRFVPEKRPGPPHLDQAHLAQFVEMVRKCGGGNPQFLLYLPGHHPGGMGGEEQSNDLQARCGAEGREAIGATGHQRRIRSHISIIAVIRFDCHRSFPKPRARLLASYTSAPCWPAKRRFFSLLTAFLLHGILATPGYL